MIAGFNPLSEQQASLKFFLLLTLLLKVLTYHSTWEGQELAHSNHHDKLKRRPLFLFNFKKTLSQEEHKPIYAA